MPTKVKITKDIAKAMKLNPHFVPDAYVQRLRLLRQLLGGLSQTEMAERLGFEMKRWNNWERGYPIGAVGAIAIIQKIPGMSAEWLWFGLEGNLSQSFLKQIRELQRKR
jgi:transcriptional regulator with XRE-family HTH domain